MASRPRDILKILKRESSTKSTFPGLNDISMDYKARLIDLKILPLMYIFEL